VSSKFDYEAEMAVVIGKVPRHVTQADALDYVFGYACFNDMSVRDYQKRTTQWTIGKNFDATGGFGPVLVTADELPPAHRPAHPEPAQRPGDAGRHHVRHDLRRGRDHRAAAECMTLEPGDVIVMGTPAGVGQARTPPVWMKAGDTIEIEIEASAPCPTPSSPRPERDRL
jgi:acylpyruvate hydrolase